MPSLTYVPLTPFQEHYNCWINGCGSEHCAKAKKCFARGKIPCDILFVGEAPGANEASTGYPFVGRAGTLLDEIVQRALALCRNSSVRCCFANLVLCIPRSAEDGAKTDEPEEDQIQCCKKRLEEFVRICKAKIVIATGRLAEDYLTQGYNYSVKLPSDVKLFSITHPAAILRASQAQRGLMQQRCIVTIATAAKELMASKV